MAIHCTETAMETTYGKGHVPACLERSSFFAIHPVAPLLYSTLCTMKNAEMAGFEEHGGALEAELSYKRPRNTLSTIAYLYFEGIISNPDNSILNV